MAGHNYTSSEKIFDNCAWLFEWQKEDIHNFLNQGYALGIDEQGRPCLIRLTVNMQGKYITAYRHLSTDEYAYTMQFLLKSAV